MNSTSTKRTSRFNILQDAILAKDENGNYKSYTAEQLASIANCQIRSVIHYMVFFRSQETWPAKGWPQNVKVKFDNETKTYQAYKD